MTVKELIDRAKQIADLVNCDFITIQECLNILNELMFKIYSDMITINDKYFINSIENIKNDFDLKTDIPKEKQFFVLEDIYEVMQFGINSLQRLQRPSKIQKGYMILNQKIKLLNVTNPVTIDYFYLPPIFTIDDYEKEDEETHELISTEIDVPNNIIIQYLAHLMAAQFKAKQGADFSLIQQTSSTLWESYKNLLDRDAHDFEQISNIYM
ncbi:hypothetical protein [Methanobrevibacter sp.]|uniref:hypothetical protein n=1 Tax=Methanobrevibacter sp. TaxID=66852 RepID=UPI00388F085E